MFSVCAAISLSPAVGGTTSGGTGLGLALVKGLVEAMSGTIRVDSVVDQGSCFSVTLPSTPAPDTATPLDDTEDQPVRIDPAITGTVLYIEDNASNVRLMEVLLSKRPGITMLHAPDGELGMAMLRARHPDVFGVLDTVLNPPPQEFPEA